MDLNSAEKTAQRLLTYIQNLSANDSKLYGKSKDKLIRISDSCENIITHISDILNIESVCGRNESNKHESEDNDDHMSSSDKRRIVTIYKDGLCHTAMTDSGSTLVNECSSLMWKWFDSRILTKHDKSPPFHYSIYRLKNILYSIVIAFGYSWESHTYHKFAEEFNSWIAQLNTNPENNRWLVPYTVYQIDKNMDKIYSNLTSVVLWDMLLDSGLGKLCDTSDKHGVYPSRTGIWDIMNRVDSSVLDDYVYYKDDYSILNKLGLT